MWVQFSFITELIPHPVSFRCHRGFLASSHMQRLGHTYQSATDTKNRTVDDQFHCQIPLRGLLRDHPLSHDQLFLRRLLIVLSSRELDHLYHLRRFFSCILNGYHHSLLERWPRYQELLLKAHA